MRARQVAAIFHHEITQGRAVTLHLEREHGAAGDLERHALHHLAQIDWPVAARRLDLRDGLLRHRNHMRDQRRNGTRREGRRQRPALVFPGPALRDQKALAEHRLQHPVARRRAAIVLVIVDQHVPDAIRRIDDEAGAAEEAALDDVLLVGALTPGCDRAVTHERHPAKGRHVVRRARRAGRHQRLPHGRNIAGFGCAHFAASRSTGWKHLEGCETASRSVPRPQSCFRQPARLARRYVPR